MNKVFVIFHTVLFLFGMSNNVDAQENESSSQNSSDTLPEEVMITGERSGFQLRSQMWELEEKAYEVFNKYNDEERFDISCSMHQPTGTRIQRQVCQANFEKYATQEHGRLYLQSLCELLCPLNLEYSAQTAHIPQEAQIASQQQEYREKLKQVAEEHPEFLQAIINYSEVKKLYTEPDDSAGE